MEIAEKQDRPPSTLTISDPSCAPGTSYNPLPLQLFQHKHTLPAGHEMASHSCIKLQCPFGEALIVARLLNCLRFHKILIIISHDHLMTREVIFFIIILAFASHYYFYIEYVLCSAHSTVTIEHERSDRNFLKIHIQMQCKTILIRSLTSLFFL